MNEFGINIMDGLGKNTESLISPSALIKSICELSHGHVTALVASGFLSFLVADTQLYKRLCSSVGPSIGPSVGLSVGHARVET